MRLWYLLAVFTIILVCPALAEEPLGDSEPARLFCGDWDGGGMPGIEDLVGSITYLWQEGPPPFSFDDFDCDDHYLYTVNDLAVYLRWAFNDGDEAVCPPGLGRLDGPVRDSIYLHTYESSYPADEILPPDVDEVTIHFYLSTDVTLQSASLAFNIRVGGEIPTIHSVTLPTGSYESFFYGSVVDQDNAKIAIGLVSADPDLDIQPGNHAYGTAVISVPPLANVWRPIELAWDSLPPDQDGEYVHYPFAVEPGRGDAWHPVISRFPCMGEMRGNIDYDENDTIDIADLVYLVVYMFQEGPAPICFEEVDMVTDLQLDIVDLVHMTNYMFQDGPPPAPCP